MNIRFAKRLEWLQNNVTKTPPLDFDDLANNCEGKENALDDYLNDDGVLSIIKTYGLDNYIKIVNTTTVFLLGTELNLTVNITKLDKQFQIKIKGLSRDFVDRLKKPLLTAEGFDINLVRGNLTMVFRAPCDGYENHITSDDDNCYCLTVTGALTHLSGDTKKKPLTDVTDKVFKPLDDVILEYRKLGSYDEKQLMAFSYLFMYELVNSEVTMKTNDEDGKTIITIKLRDNANLFLIVNRAEYKIIGMFRKGDNLFYNGMYFCGFLQDFKDVMESTIKEFLSTIIDVRDEDIVNIDQV